jgi:hypothetical protein
MLTSEERWVEGCKEGYWYRTWRRELEIFVQGLVGWGKKVSGQIEGKRAEEKKAAEEEEARNKKEKTEKMKAEEENADKTEKKEGGNKRRSVNLSHLGIQG